MTFMTPVIEFGKWYEIETMNGTSFVPFDIVGTIHQAFLGNPPSSYARKRVLQYTECFDVKDINTIEIREGFGARLSENGYLDCTDWTVFDSEQEAKDYLVEMHDAEFSQEGN